MLFEVAHQIALIPLVLMLLRGRGLPRAYWLVAIAFAVSWLGDSLMWAFEGPWAASHVWLPIQFALVFAALLRGWALLHALWATMLAGIGSYMLGTPDVLVTTIGSIAVLWLARGRLGAPLAAYFGAGTIAYLWMVATFESGIMPAWYTYQACRLVAFGAFVWVALHWRHDGLDDGMAARPDRRVRGGARGESAARRAPAEGE